jgi:hypothetical protein
VGVTHGAPERAVEGKCPPVGSGVVTHDHGSRAAVGLELENPLAQAALPSIYDMPRDGVGKTTTAFTVSTHLSITLQFREGVQGAIESESCDFFMGVGSTA